MVEHWYLLVVHVKDKIAKIIDSAPNKFSEYIKQEAARLTVKFYFLCYKSIGTEVMLQWLLLSQYAYIIMNPRISHI